MTTYEKKREELRARLAEATKPRPAHDVAAVRQKLAELLVDWQRLLRGHVHQGQQVLRRLIVGKLTFTPHPDGYYTFSGRGTVQPVIAGAIRNLASPTGIVETCPVKTNRIRAA